MNLPPRLKLLQQYLLTHHLDGFIVSKRENLHYLTGLNQLHPTSREALLLVTPTTSTLYHSPFLTHTYPNSIPMNPASPPAQVLPQVFPHPTVLGIEANNYTVSELTKLKTIFPHTQIQETQDVIESFRLTKDADEIKLLARAGQITAQLMSWARQSLQPSNRLTASELEFSHLLEHQAHLLGADGLAFPSVVSFGPHTALPHHQAGSTQLKPGPVLLDLGVKYHGYCSDCTRTFWLGTPSPQFLEIQKSVHSAYDSALDLLSHHFHIQILTSNRRLIVEPLSNYLRAIIASDLDQTTRSVIEKAGFGDKFIHTTGHGLGLEIHEAPSLNSKNNSPLLPGMVLTLEPGIYLPNEFGYRLENTLLLS